MQGGTANKGVVEMRERDKAWAKFVWAECRCMMEESVGLGVEVEVGEVSIVVMCMSRREVDQRHPSDRRRVAAVTDLRTDAGVCPRLIILDGASACAHLTLTAGRLLIV